MAMPYRFALAALLAIAALDRTAPAAADGTYTLQFENDRIAETDRHYTNGMRLSWVSNSKSPSASPQWARDVLGWIYRQVDEELEGRIGLALGQSIFTPEDTAARRLVVDDRPYAGWLYGGISAHTQRPGAVAGIGLEMLDTVELDVGVVGPLALGEEVQNNFHDLIGVGRSNRPREASAQYWRGKALEALGRNEEAKAAWKLGAAGSRGSGEQSEYIELCEKELSKTK